MSEAQLRKALAAQARRVQAGNAELLGAVLVEIGAVEIDDLEVELEKQARDRAHVYGEESTGEQEEGR